MKSMLLAIMRKVFMSNLIGYGMFFDDLGAISLIPQRIYHFQVEINKNGRDNPNLFVAKKPKTAYELSQSTREVETYQDKT